MRKALAASLVITYIVLIGFYFSTNAFTAYLDKLKDRPKDDNNLKDLQKILKEKIAKTTDEATKKMLLEILDEIEKSQKKK